MHKNPLMLLGACVILSVVPYAVSYASGQSSGDDSALVARSGNQGVDTNNIRRQLAEEWYHRFYEGDPSVVDDLADEDVVLSYSSFLRLFDKPGFRGRKAVKDLSRGFNERWAETNVTFHEAVAEGDLVVLLWSFTGRYVRSVNKDIPADNEMHSWGGIAFVRFNDENKIVEDFGLESEPGPFELVEECRK